jgi:hypothetical protein
MRRLQATRQSNVRINKNRLIFPLFIFKTVIILFLFFIGVKGVITGKEGVITEKEGVITEKEGVITGFGTFF